MALSFTIAAGPRQSSHFQVQVPRDTWSHLLSQIREFPNLEGQVPVFSIYPKNRVAQLYLRHWIPFSSPSTTRKEAFEPASTRVA
jgi:hypothetical protein